MKKPRILVVDDEVGVRDSLKWMLGDNYQVVAVKDGSEALDKIREEPFDVIFLDIIMPGLGGSKTCQAIEAINPEAKIIMMTGYGPAVSDDIEKALKAGAYECISKPFTVPGLLKMLDKVLKK
jgi:DNA-binding NtrC family response regulator